MGKKVHQVHGFHFAHFISDPLVGSAILVFALIALFLSISEFSQVLSAY